MTYCGPAPELSVRRHGEPPPDVRHPDPVLAGDRSLVSLVARMARFAFVGRVTW